MVPGDLVKCCDSSAWNTQTQGDVSFFDIEYGCLGIVITVSKMLRPDNTPVEEDANLVLVLLPEGVGWLLEFDVVLL